MKKASRYGPKGLLSSVKFFYICKVGGKGRTGQYIHCGLNVTTLESLVHFLCHVLAVLLTSQSHSLLGRHDDDNIGDRFSKTKIATIIYPTKKVRLSHYTNSLSGRLRFYTEFAFIMSWQRHTTRPKCVTWLIQKSLMCIIRSRTNIRYRSESFHSE